MRFLIDAHLPPALAAVLVGGGHEARHTRELPGGNRTRDGLINEVSAAEIDRVSVTVIV